MYNCPRPQPLILLCLFPKFRRETLHVQAESVPGGPVLLDGGEGGDGPVVCLSPQRKGDAPRSAILSPPGGRGQDVAV